MRAGACNDLSLSCPASRVGKGGPHAGDQSEHARHHGADEVYELARTADHRQPPAVYDRLVGSSLVYLAGEAAAQRPQRPVAGVSRRMRILPGAGGRPCLRLPSREKSSMV
jgi:hypothetical protein